MKLTLLWILFTWTLFFTAVWNISPSGECYLFSLGLGHFADIKMATASGATTRIPTPTYKAGQSYELFKKELKLWEKITSVEKSAMGLHVLLCLPGKDKDPSGIKERLLESCSVNDLNKDDGLDHLITEMDKFLAKDEIETAWDKFQEFESYSKCDEESMSQYIANFDLKYEKVKNSGQSEKITLPSSILAFKLLKGANLNEEQRLVVMTGLDFDKSKELYEDAKKSLKKFMSGGMDSSDSNYSNISIKSEPTFYASSFRGRGRGNRQSSVSRGPIKNTYSNPSSRQKDLNPKGRDGHILRCYTCDSYRHMGSSCPKEKSINSNGKDGQPLRCLVCESVRHLLGQCPHSWESMSRSNTVNYAPVLEELEYLELEDPNVAQIPESNYLEPVIMFTQSQSDLQTLSQESYYSGVLDSGCSSTVCGEKWLNVYLDRLSEDQRQSVTIKPSDKVFQFGGELKVPSKGKLVLPGEIVGRKVMINTDVVESDIPMLFSKDALGSMQAKIDYATDEAIIMGKPVVLDKTSIGHHCIRLIPETQEVNNVNVLDSSTDEKHNIFLKLHRQYGHPGKNTFINHLKTADIWSDECGNIVDNIYSDCKICKQYARTPSRPIVALPLASEFNECVAIDLKYWRENLWILHMVDVYSRFTQSVLITSKRPKVVIDAIILNWIGNFGVMKKLLSDCLGNSATKTCEKFLHF